VKSGRELGRGFKEQPLKRQALKQHNIKVHLGEYEKGNLLRIVSRDRL